MTSVAPVLETTFSNLKLFRRGKVRDVYEIDQDRLLIVATDRISAFDSVSPTPIERKGEVLTACRAFGSQSLRTLCQTISSQLRLMKCLVRFVRTQTICGAGRCSSSARKFFPWNASCAAIFPAQVGRIINGPVRFAVTNCLPACAIRKSYRNQFSLRQPRPKSATTKTSVKSKCLKLLAGM